jgi:hypothetical protein
MVDFQHIRLSLRWFYWCVFYLASNPHMVCNASKAVFCPTQLGVFSSVDISFHNDGYLFIPRMAKGLGGQKS